MIDITIADRLDALLPLLHDGRQTHVEWGEWMRGDTDGSRAAENPGAGSAGFHASMVAEYDNRIKTVTEAAAAIRAEYALQIKACLNATNDKLIRIRGLQPAA